MILSGCFLCLVRAGQHGVHKGLLLEEDEPVEGGEEDDGQKDVGEIPRRGNHQLGQAPQVHCHLTRPAAPPTRNIVTQAKTPVPPL